MTTQNKAIVDKLLTNVSQKLKPLGYISEDILTPRIVVQDSGLIGRYGNESLRILSDTTGGKNKYPEVQTETRLSDTYNVVKHGLKGILTEEDFRNVEKPFDARFDLIQQLTTNLWLGKEKSLADTLGNVSVITNNTTLSGTAQWNDFDNSSPLTNFITARQAVFDGACMPPNLVVMSWQVAETLRYHPQMLDALGFKDARPGGLSDPELARAILPNVEGGRVLIGTACFNNSVEGQADSIESVWGKNCLFIKTEATAALRQTTLGYRIQVTEPRRVFRSTIQDPPNAEMILVDDAYDQLLTNTNAAYLIKDAIA